MTSISNISSLLTLYSERFLFEKPLTVVEAVAAPDSCSPSHHPSSPPVICIDSPSDYNTRSPLIIRLKSPQATTSMTISSSHSSSQQTGVNENIFDPVGTVVPHNNDAQSTIIASIPAVTVTSDKIFINKNDREDITSQQNNSFPPDAVENCIDVDDDFINEFFGETEIKSSAPLHPTTDFSSAVIQTPVLPSTTVGCSFIPKEALHIPSLQKESALPNESYLSEEKMEDEIIFTKDDELEIFTRLEKEDKKCTNAKRHSLIKTPKLARYEQYSIKIQTLIKIQHAEIIKLLKKQYIINQIKNEEIRQLISKKQFM